MLKNDLHPKIINFLTSSTEQIQNISIGTIGNSVIAHYVGELGCSGYPQLNQVIAFEYHDSAIKYWFNGKGYSENKMLRMIDLKAFI